MFGRQPHATQQVVEEGLGGARHGHGHDLVVGDSEQHQIARRVLDADLVASACEHVDFEAAVRRHWVGAQRRADTEAGRVRAPWRQADGARHADYAGRWWWRWRATARHQSGQYEEREGTADQGRTTASVPEHGGT